MDNIMHVDDIKKEITNLVDEAKKHMVESIDNARIVVENKKEEIQYQLHEKMIQFEQMANDIDWFIAAPLIISCAAFWGIFMYRSNGDDFIVSSIHAIVVVILAFGNMFWGLDERVMFVVMTGYFISDLLYYCLMSKYAIFIIHHVVTVFAMYHMVTAAHFNAHFMASKAVMVEISTPFLNHYNKTNKALHGALFALSFIAVRVIWLTHITVLGISVSKYPIEIILAACFVCLNAYWFIEILRKGYQSIKNTGPVEKK